MPTVLLFIVANFVVQLLQVVLQSRDLVGGCSDSVLKTHDVFVSLLDDFTLVSDPVFSAVDLGLHAHN